MLTGSGTRSARDIDITAGIATSALPATSGEMRFILLARRVDGTNDYQGSVRILPSGAVRLEVRRSINGSETTLGSSVTISGLTASANSFLRVRMQVTGMNPAAINLRLWADGSSEPTTWAVTRTDSSAMLQQAGSVGLRTQLTTGATNAPVTGSWDDWQVLIQASEPQQDLAPVPSFDQTYGYDQLGNLTTKAGVVQQYGANGNGTGARPHAVMTVGGNAYSYDANGNLLRGGGRTLSWNAENQPTHIVSGGATETYQYDADGARVTRSVTPGLSTRYAFGLYEVEGAITRKYYTMAGQVLAVRDSGLGLSYLYGDHLGSVSASTNASGSAVQRQYFDAWGKRLAGSVSQTKRTFTGQYLDDTGLLFYNARYYDPGIGRFVSADSIVPGNASGGMAGIASKPLTVDFHENGFVAAVNRENQFGPWYTLSDKERRQVGVPWGPANPQALNRYSSVLNNPMRWTDPSGHALKLPKRWEDWQARAHQVIDTYHQIISSELGRMRTEIDAFIDSGGTLTMEWISQKIRDMNLSPILIELIEAAASILGNGIVSTGLKMGPWMIYAVTQVVLLAHVLQQHQRVNDFPYILTENERKTMPLPGRAFFPGGRAWDQAYCHVNKAC